MTPSLSLERRLTFPVHLFLRFAFLLLAYSAVNGATEITRLDTAPEPKIGPRPEWIKPAVWTAPLKVEETPSGQDFLVVDEQRRLATHEDYFHRVYQIVTDGGRQNSSQVYMYFDPSYQKLTIHHLNVVRDNVISDRLDPNKIQVIQQERDLDRQLYNGERSALVILEDVRIGDIIDLAYTIEGENPVFDGKFIDSASLDWSVPVRDMRYRALVPGHRTVLSRIQGSAQPLFSSKIHEGEQELEWTRANALIVETEDNVPSSHPSYSYLELSEFKSWSEVVEWALPLYAPRPRWCTVHDAIWF